MQGESSHEDTAHSMPFGTGRAPKQYSIPEVRKRNGSEIVWGT